MPYYTSVKHGNFGEKNREFIRYLNALKDGDAALGVILDALELKGLSETTLVVVLGDHGEAFFRHNQKGHACGIYEENVHIPFILINPQLYHGEENDVLGGVVDIGPTILDLLGMKTPDEWQGRSLFSKDRSPRVYFFAPWSRKVFGMREGSQKYIYDATRQTMEIYDVLNDPLETKNLADYDPTAVELARQRIAAWVQGQIKFMKNLATRR
jgi:arylsulfatase A-like enzyme